MVWRQTRRNFTAALSVTLRTETRKAFEQLLPQTHEEPFEKEIFEPQTLPKSFTQAICQPFPKKVSESVTPSRRVTLGEPLDTQEEQA